jgi:hypothetical protein
MGSHLSDKERRIRNWERSRRDRDDENRYEFHGRGHSRPQLSNVARTEIVSHATIAGVYRRNPESESRIDMLIFPYTFPFGEPLAKTTIRFIAGTQKVPKHGPLDTLKRELDEELIDPQKGTVNLIQPEIVWWSLGPDQNNPRGHHLKILYMLQVDRHDVFRDFTKVDKSNGKQELLGVPYWEDIGEIVESFSREGFSTKAHALAAPRLLDAVSVLDRKIYDTYSVEIDRYCRNYVEPDPNPLVENYLAKFNPTAS